jgi:hypothetical protein
MCDSALIAAMLALPDSAAAGFSFQGPRAAASIRFRTSAMRSSSPTRSSTPFGKATIYGYTVQMCNR